MKTTDELYHEIKSTANILDYFEKNQSEMQLNSFCECLEEWLSIKKLTRANVVKNSNLNKAYVYQIFSGKRYPSRDKVLALGFGFQMNCEEAQTLLKQAGYRDLYPRDPRDTLLIYAYGAGMDIISANELLYDHDIEVLE